MPVKRLVVGFILALATLSTAAPVQAGHYGAIAYGPASGAYGYSYRWGSQGEAERVAMQNCAQHGDDCQVMVWFERRCGAVVSGDNATAFWGLGFNTSEADTEGMNKCSQAGATNCTVQVTQCSF